MEESKEDSPFKKFEGKKVLIITKSDFKYHTNSLKVSPKYLEFTDKFGCHFFLLNSEVKMIQENGN